MSQSRNQDQQINIDSDMNLDSPETPDGKLEDETLYTLVCRIKNDKDKDNPDAQSGGEDEHYLSKYLKYKTKYYNLKSQKSQKIK